VTHPVDPARPGPGAVPAALLRALQIEVGRRIEGMLAGEYRSSRHGDGAELAQVRTTNSWEVVTGMARRLPRVYHAPSGVQGLRTLVSRPGPAIDPAPRRRTKRS